MAQKLDILGFSEHAPYPDDRFDLRMKYNELHAYINSLKKMQLMYKDKLEIRIGLEIEYDAEQIEYYHYLKNRLGIEYLLLGQHIFTTRQGRRENTYCIGNRHDASLCREYAISLQQGMESGLFDAVAHPDLFFINHLPYDDVLEETCQIIANAAFQTGTPLEYNANGIRRGHQLYPEGLRYPYPCDYFWALIACTQHPVVIGSDCHQPDQLWDYAVRKARVEAEKHSLRITNIL